MLRLLVSTGEVSGDLQGSFLVKALLKEAKKRSLPIEILAFGGPRMKESGAHLVADTSNIGAIGLWEALPLILPTLKIQSKINYFLKNNPPDGVVLIDYMGPNIRLGNKLKKWKEDIPIIYYIAPQEWAWSLGDGGTTDLITFTDKILAIFQEEAEFYKKRGGNVNWVGHPMLDTTEELPERSEAIKNLGLDVNSKHLLLFPASRLQEIKYMLPIFIAAVSFLQKIDPSIYVIVPAGLKSFEKPIKSALCEARVKGKVISSHLIDQLKPSLFSVADIALCKSGTINMELALNNVPQIVGYKVSRVTSLIARKILRFNVDHISPVNLILKERLVPELIQEDFNVESLVWASSKLLENSENRDEMISGYNRMKYKLGNKGVTNRAAIDILDLVQS